MTGATERNTVEPCRIGLDVVDVVDIQPLSLAADGADITIALADRPFKFGVERRRIAVVRKFFAFGYALPAPCTHP